MGVGTVRDVGRPSMFPLRVGFSSVFLSNFLCILVLTSFLAREVCIHKIVKIVYGGGKGKATLSCLAPCLSA